MTQNVDPPSLEMDSTLDPNNVYTRMQQGHYESTAHLMNVDNHMFHNGNQDYWDILVADTERDYRDKVGLDFGCGCGRNMQNLWMRFRQMHGVDLSARNLAYARENILKCGCPEERFRLFECDGVDLQNLATESYDFITSTIVFQHICVYQIRLNYLREFYRIAKPGCLLSMQMGFGEGHGKAGYYDDHYQAQSTNSGHDTMVTDPEALRTDLEAVGFVNFRYWIRPAFHDMHPSWIFFKANKPLCEDS